jgi:hypothetical protein
MLGISLNENEMPSIVWSMNAVGSIVYIVMDHDLTNLILTCNTE